VATPGLMASPRTWLTRASGLILGAVACAAPVASQPAPDCEDGWLGSPAVRSEAWTAGAVRWLNDRGALAGWPLPQGEIPVSVAACLFDRAEGILPTESWSRRLQAEVGDAAAPRERDGAGLSGRGAIGLADRQGQAAPGQGLVGPDATGADQLPGARGLVGDAWALGFSDRFHGFAHAGRDPGGSLVLHGGDLGVQVGSFGVAIGRGAVRYGAGGLIFSGGVPLDRIEIATVRPLQPPAALGFLGAMAGHTFLATLPDARHAGDPWLWGGSLTLQPIPRLEVGIHRGMMLGGDATTTPLTPATLMYAFLGKHNNFRGEYIGGVRNQILSVDLRYRPPLHPAWPLTLYLEWGTEDSAGGFRDVPGIVAGLRTSPLFGHVPVTVGVEQTYLGEGQRRGNPPWYRHSIFQGGWAAGDRPLGHPLGGHGREWAAYLWAEAPAGVRLDLRAMMRRRGTLNLFVPGWEGRSRGLDASGAWSVRRGVDLVADSRWESGSGWSRWDVRAGVEASLR
jgi:hypothetical protein